MISSAKDNVEIFVVNLLSGLTYQLGGKASPVVLCDVLPGWPPLRIVMLVYDICTNALNKSPDETVRLTRLRCRHAANHGYPDPAGKRHNPRFNR